MDITFSISVESGGLGGGDGGGRGGYAMPYGLDDAGGMCGLATIYGSSGGSTPGGRGSPCSFSRRGSGGGEDGRGGLLGGRGGSSAGGGGGGGGGGALGGGGRGGKGGNMGLLVGLDTLLELSVESELLLTPAAMKQTILI